MAIYQLFEEEKKQHFTETFDQTDVVSSATRGNRVFATLVTRFCFLLLLVGDLAWLVYNTCLFLAFAAFFLITGGKQAHIAKCFHKALLHLRRSLVCALALLVGLFSPPFGIMVACTYFLMYDKTGMEEVVPASLQAQIKDIFRTDL